LGQQLDDAAQKFMTQYDSTAIEDNIAAFESEFLDRLSRVDGPIRRATYQPPKQDIVAALTKMSRELFLENILAATKCDDQLLLLEYFVCVVGLCAISSSKQQQYNTSFRNRCYKR
jgi:hypothetical protein